MQKKDAIAYIINWKQDGMQLSDVKDAFFATSMAT